MSKIISIKVAADNSLSSWFGKLPAFPNNHEFALDPGITWVVGENGSGKSKLLLFLLRCLVDSKSDPLQVTLEDEGIQTPVHYFDSHKMNPGILSEIKTMYQVETIVRHLSHGQTILPILKAMGHEEKFVNSLCLIDEPEAGISPWNQVDLLHELKKAVAERSIQIIAATHSILFAESGVGSVLDLNSNPAKLISSNNYKVFT